ncbi:MAG TPA: hypothetical protein VN844_09250 [Pyrinomonadaceae bacterium]|nr:hypothetical protein [Pyrinomonadaceae bacterium]
MLKADELVQAVDLHRRSYNLLLWLRTAIAKGVIQVTRAHEYMDEAEAAEDWIESHFLNLPPNCRPEREQLKPFSRFFATYLTTSFELVDQPFHLLESKCGCCCPICAYLTGPHHLKTKKLFRRDKERARKIKIAALQQLSREHNKYLAQEQAEKLVDSHTTAREIAMLAYGQQLVARTRGNSEGPAVLALWREIAWNRTAPKKDFTLEAEDILQAEQTLAGTLVNLD